MKFIVEADFPLEPFSTYVREGTAGEKVGEVLGAIKPERHGCDGSGLLSCAPR